MNCKEAKAKLAAGGFMPGHVDEFCRLLGERLQDETTPDKFLLTYSLLISDIEKGEGRNVPGGPHGVQHSYIGGLAIGPVLNLLMGVIIKKIFPDEFAREVLEARNSVLREIKARQ